MSIISAEEFAQYWEDRQEDDQMAIDWLSAKISSVAGIADLRRAIDILASKHGVTSDPVKGLRAFIRKAYLKVNKERAEAGEQLLEVMSFSIKQDKDTGIIASHFHTPKKGGKKATPFKTAKKQIQSWMKQWGEQGISLEDIHAAIEAANTEAYRESV